MFAPTPSTYPANHLRRDAAGQLFTATMHISRQQATRALETRHVQLQSWVFRIRYLIQIIAVWVVAVITKT